MNLVHFLIKLIGNDIKICDFYIALSIFILGIEKVFIRNLQVFYELGHVAAENSEWIIRCDSTFMSKHSPLITDLSHSIYSRFVKGMFELWSGVQFAS